MVMLPIPESMCTVNNVSTSTQSENGKIKQKKFLSFMNFLLSFF